MHPRETRDDGQLDLFRSRLDQIIDLSHPRSKLAGLVDWGRLERRFSAYYSDAGRLVLQFV